MDALTIVFGAVDLPLVAGIVGLVQVLKALVKVPAKWAKLWLLVVIAAGFLAAWLKINVTQTGWKPFIAQGVVYAAAASFLWQGWKMVTSGIKAAKK